VDIYIHCLVSLHVRRTANVDYTAHGQYTVSSISLLVPLMHQKYMPSLITQLLEQLSSICTSYNTFYVHKEGGRERLARRGLQTMLLIKDEG
jgi:hypothetical protein